MSPTIRYLRDDRVARIVIDHPQKRNAFAASMREELAFALDRAQQDADVRVVILRGEGANFCAGGDLDHLAALAAAADGEGLTRLLEAGSRVVRTIRRMEKPVIAAVEGSAAGAGCSLAAAADLVVAAETASFSLPFVRIGFVPDWGATWSMPRRIGAARTLWMSTTGTHIDARTAHAWGLVDRLAPATGFEAELQTLASTLAAASPTSLLFQKVLIGTEELPALEEALARELEAQTACFETEDFRRAMAAHREKRTKR